MIYESGNYTADDYDGGDCDLCYDGFNWDATKIDQGLAYGRDVKCNKNDDTSCDYVNTNSTYLNIQDMLDITGTQYFGRGSFHMRWNDRYAKFS